ncbi:hypothetical protein ACFL6S_08355, partial [Candidatus Poribacteria bacterium]
MEEKLEPFVRYGAKEDRIEVSADEILDAIAEGRDVNIGYVILNGDLDVRRIAEKLEYDGQGKLVIKGRGLSTLLCKLRPSRSIDNP